MFRGSRQSYRNTFNATQGDPDDCGDRSSLDRAEVQIYADSVGWLPYNRLDRLDRPSPLKMCSGNGHGHLELTALITDATRLGRLQSPEHNIEPVYRLFSISLSGSSLSSQSSQKLKEIETIRRLHGNQA